MTTPAVGKGPDHANKVRAGMERARALRFEYIDKLAAGEMSFPDVVELSREYEFEPLSKIKLIDILGERPGWNELTAKEALLHQGFDLKDTIRSIRRSVRKINLFAVLVDVDSTRWKPRPKMPYGWPFFGKLERIFSDNPESFEREPDELRALFETEDDEFDRQHDNDPEPSDDDWTDDDETVDADSLARLLEGDD